MNRRAPTNDGLLSLRLCLLFNDFLVLDRYEQLGLLALHELVVLAYLFGYLGLGDAHRLDDQAGRDHVQVLLQSVLQMLVDVSCKCILKM